MMSANLPPVILSGRGTIIAPSIGRPHAKGYRKMIGRYWGADGKSRPKIWWLGQHRETAAQAASVLYAMYTQFRANGMGQEWTAEAMATAKDVLDGIKEQWSQTVQQAQMILASNGQTPPPAPSSPDAPAAKQEKTLHDAIDAYVEAVKAKAWSDPHKGRAIQVLNTNLKCMKDKHGKLIAPNCPLAEIDFAWVERVCDKFKSRPPGLKDGKPISAQTVKTIMQYLRQFFDWMESVEYGGWQAPRKLMKPFKFRKSELMTPSELRAAKQFQQFDIPTLVALYKAASDFQRRLMLTALFTGGTQKELAVLEQSEFDLSDGSLAGNTATHDASGGLHHFRNKSGVEGKFWLPPELITMLKADFARRPGDKLAFRTCEGNPLVTYNPETFRVASDAVRQSWDDLREVCIAAGVPKEKLNSFKWLRKFLAHWMTKRGGLTIGQIALCQQFQTVLEINYDPGRDFPAFNRLQQELYAELKAAGMFNTGVAQTAAA